MDPPSHHTLPNTEPTAKHDTTRFDVFEHAPKAYEAVKWGFSWPAFFFALPWVFWKRLWVQGILVLASMVALAVIPGLAEFEQLSFGRSGLGVSLSLLFGFRGNEWRRARLEAQGWIRVATVEAETPSQAIALVRVQARARIPEVLAAALRLELSGDLGGAMRECQWVLQRFPGSEPARNAEANIRRLKQKLRE